MGFYLSSTLNALYHNMRKIYFITLALSTLLYECRQYGQSVSSSLLTDYIADSVYLPFGEADFPHNGINVVSADEASEQITYLNRNSFIYYTYNLQQEKITDSLSLVKYRRIMLDYYAGCSDSLFLLLENNKLALVTENHEKIFNLQHLSERVSSNGSFSNSSSGIQFYKDTIIVDVTPQYISCKS